MITEQELNQVGKEQYIAFARLIGAVVAHKEHRKENAKIDSEEIWLENEPDAISEAIFKFDPNDDPRFIRIPGVKIDALWGSAENDGWKKWEQSISWLVDDFVLNDFVRQLGKHENPQNHTLVSSLQNMLDIQNLLDGTTDRMHMQYWDVLVMPRMSATEIEQYVDEVRSIGEAKPKAQKHAIEKSDAGVENTKEARQMLVIDEQKGVYFVANPNKFYDIAGKRKLLILTLLKKEKKATLKILKKIYGDNETVTMNTITAVNKLFRENLDVTDDLITHNKTGGYMLNTEKYRIEKKS